MADDFLKHTGVETGYWDKRKTQFNNEIAKGINSVGVQAKVQAKPKHNADKLISKNEVKEPPQKKAEVSGFTTKTLPSGRVMYFKDNLIVSKDAYEAGAKA